MVGITESDLSISSCLSFPILESRSDSSGTREPPVDHAVESRCYLGVDHWVCCVK